MDILNFFKQKHKEVKGYVDGAKTGVNFVSRVVNAALDDGSGNNIYQKLVVNLSGINKGDNLLSLNTLSRLRSEVKGLNISKKFDNIISEIVEQDVKSKPLGLLDKISYKKALKIDLSNLTTSTKEAWRAVQPSLLDSLGRLYNQSKKMSDLIDTGNKLEAVIFKRKGDILKLLNWAIAGNSKVQSEDKNRAIKNNIDALSRQAKKIDIDIKKESMKVHKLYKDILEKIENKLKKVIQTKDDVANKQIKDIENCINNYLPIELEKLKDFNSLKDCIDNLPETLEVNTNINLKELGNTNINQVTNFVRKYINPKLEKSKKLNEQDLILEWFKSKKTPLDIENNVSKPGRFWNNTDRNLLIEIECDFKEFFNFLDKHNKNIKQKRDDKVAELNRLINLKCKEKNLSDKDLLNLPTHMEEKIYAMIKYYDIKSEDYNKAKRWLESNKEVISKIEISDTSYSTESILLFKWFPKNWKKDSRWKKSKLYKSFEEIENLNKEIKGEKRKKSAIPDWNNKQFDLKNDAELFNCIKSLDKFVPLFRNKTENINKIINTIYEEISKTLLVTCKLFNTSTNEIAHQHGKALEINKAAECPFGANVNLYKFMKYLENQAQEIVNDKTKIRDSLVRRYQLDEADDWIVLDNIVVLWEQFTNIKHGIITPVYCKK